jgi:hypothetical protein
MTRPPPLIAQVATRPGSPEYWFTYAEITGLCAFKDSDGEDLNSHIRIGDLSAYKYVTFTRDERRK